MQNGVRSEAHPGLCWSCHYLKPDEKSLVMRLPILTCVALGLVCWGKPVQGFAAVTPAAALARGFTPLLAWQAPAEAPDGDAEEAAASPLANPSPASIVEPVSDADETAAQDLDDDSAPGSAMTDEDLGSGDNLKASRPGSRDKASVKSTNSPRRDSSVRRDRSSNRAPSGRSAGLRGFRTSGTDAQNRTNSVARLGYASFKIITDRNIFNSTRSGASSRPVTDQRKAARVDMVSLVGILCSDKGEYAFFDGSSSEYKQALARGKSIVGYRVAEITPNLVKLESGTNLVQLHVGGQLRREDEVWHVADATIPAPAAASSDTTSTATDSAGGDENDIVKRLMRQRELETK